MTEPDTLDPDTSITPAAGGDQVAITGEVVDDPGTPCTPEYARELTDRAATALDTFNDTMTEIVRVRAWEPLGYSDARSYVLTEFQERVGRSHRYRLARVSQVLSMLTERLGDQVLDDVEITENALRSVPAGADDAVVDEIVAAAQSDEGLDQEAVEDAIDAHRPPGKKQRAEPEDSADEWAAGEAPWETQDDAYTARIAADEEIPDDEGVPGQRRPASRPASDDVPDDEPSAASALAEATTFEQFMRALRQVAEIEPLLPGILDYADDMQLLDIQDWAKQARDVLGQVAEAADDAI